LETKIKGDREMKIYEVGHLLNLPPNHLLYASEGITKVLDRYPNNVEGLVNELTIISGCRWQGIRKYAGSSFTSNAIMDRLEVLAKDFPDAKLCAGTFPRPKGPPCRQILWFVARQMPSGEIVTLIGLEEELAPFWLTKEAIIQEPYKS